MFPQLKGYSKTMSVAMTLYNRQNWLITKLIDKRIDDLILQPRSKRNRKLKKIFK